MIGRKQESQPAPESRAVRLLRKDLAEVQSAKEKFEGEAANAEAALRTAQDNASTMKRVEEELIEALVVLQRGDLESEVEGL